MRKHQRIFLRLLHLKSGIPKGAIVELLGPCRIEWFIQFLKLHLDFRIFWSEDQQRILPTALHQRGLDLTKITFGLFGEKPEAPLRRVIQSQLYQVVLAPNKFTEIKVLKAFQLWAEKSNTTIFLLGKEEPSTAWPISLQLEVHRHPKNEFRIEILKQKHGQLL